MITAVWLIFIAAMLGSALCSGTETGVYCVNRLRVQLGAQRGDRRAQRLARILDEQQSAVMAILIGNNVTNYAGTAACAYLLGHYLDSSTLSVELYTVALLTPLVFIFGEVTPKNLFQANADALMPPVSGPLELWMRLLRATGVIPMLRAMTRGAARLLREDPGILKSSDPRRRVALLLSEALAGRTVDEEQSRLVERSLQLAETPLHAVMVPRSLVVTVPAEADRRELLAVARRTRHRRAPVVDPKSRQVIGLADIDALLAADDWTTVGQQAAPILALRPADTVGSAIPQMQQGGHAMAVVTDRSGQMLGLVTIKDLLEELVGELGAL